MTKSIANKWLVPFQTNSDAEIAIISIPYAGGNPVIFYEWKNNFPKNTSYYGCYTPGRMNFLYSSQYNFLEEVIPSLCEELRHIAENQKIILIGHSMGGLIAYECAVYLESKYDITLHHLVISASRPPHKIDLTPPIHTLSDNDFVKKISSYQGTPAELLLNKELMDCVIPILKTDFKIIENYSNKKHSAISCQLTALSGKDDKLASFSEMELWSSYTKDFKHILVEGGHFFITENNKAYLEHLNDILFNSHFRKDIGRLLVQ